MDESESPQSLYAKNLKQSFGYPLRFPEPKPGLPLSYEEHGLHIGDVGYVDDVGMFEVLFNICLPSDHDLHQARCDDLDGLVGLAEVSSNEVPPIVNAFPSGRVICHGIQGSHGDSLKHTQSASCKFVSCSTSGSILILPSGAVRQNLNKSREDQFRKLAEKCALDWCQFADRKSLYLITGFYKTNSWYLAWYHDTGTTGQIILERDGEGRHNWNAQCDYRESSKENRNENQAVLISGFKIEVRGWDEHAVVEKLTPYSRTILSELKLLASLLLGILIFFWKRMISRYVSKLLRESGTPRRTDGAVRVNRVPPFAQPFHPSDVINRYLLEKNPSGQVVVTHDSQWLRMLEKSELPHEDMMEEGRFMAFLEENYTDGSHSDNVLYLQRRIDHDEPNDQDHVTASCKSAHPRKTFSHHASGNIRGVVITHMRVENTVACLKRMPVGFYVLIQFGGSKRRSRPKSVLLRDSVIEWEDEIILPTDSSVDVQLSIKASFEFEPMLGNGQTVCMSKISVGELAEAGNRCLRFPSGSKEGGPSLLITIEERQLDCHADQSHRKSECEDILYAAVAEETDAGHDALLRYHKSHDVSELNKSIGHFELALGRCPSDHECRAAALFNLATARFMNCKVHGTISQLDMAITSYRETLVLRQKPHPDRPRTLLHLAEALLYGYGRSRCESSVADEIEGLTAEVKRICHGDSYEHRAADLIVQTLKRYQILASGTLVELDKLVPELSQSAHLPPDWYFDRPYRMINPSTVLRKRFELTGVLDHLEKSISVMEEAAQLISDGHFDKPWMLVFLGDALCARFLRHGDVCDRDKSISAIEEAIKLTPDGHVDKPWMVDRLGAALLVRFVCSNPFGLNLPISMLGSVVQFTPKARLDQLSVAGTKGISDTSDLERSISNLRGAADCLVNDDPHRLCCLANLASSLLVRFWCLGDPSDLEEAVSRHRDAVKIAPNSFADQLACLNNLALSLGARFEQTKELAYLEEAISRYEEAVERIPDDHADKSSYLNSLGNSFLSRFDCLGELSDVEGAISSHKMAVERTPDGHADKPSYLNNLGGGFFSRFKRLGELSDVEDAISRHERAVEQTPDGHPDKPSYLNDLGNSLVSRFESLGQQNDIKAAISNHKDAVALAPADIKHRYLNSLALSFSARFKRVGEMNDIEEAISNLMDAVKLAPDGHSDNARHLNDLTLTLEVRFEHLGKLVELRLLRATTLP